MTFVRSREGLRWCAAAGSYPARVFVADFVEVAINRPAIAAADDLDVAVRLVVAALRPACVRLLSRSHDMPASVRCPTLR
jgi:hypothetical protein